MAKRNKHKNTIARIPVHFIDVLPTFQELLKVEYPKKLNGQNIIPPDGISFLSAIKGENQNDKRVNLFSGNGDGSYKRW